MMIIAVVVAVVAFWPAMRRSGRQYASIGPACALACKRIFCWSVCFESGAHGVFRSERPRMPSYETRAAELIPRTPRDARGFQYTTDLLSQDEERELVDMFGRLPFEAFEFHGYVGRRRVVSYGWRYDFDGETLRQSDDLPAFLNPARDKAAAVFGFSPSDLQHALVTEYAPGAAIGWHKDKAVFAELIGVSLRSPCTFRFRRKVGLRWERASSVAEPRSAYFLAGASRTEWEHSIPAVDSLRYSITFRNLRHR